MKVILGSQSPRRVEILSFFSLPFEQKSSSFDEDSIPFNGNPHDYVCILSKEKAQVLAKNYPEAVIITADTTVFFNGKIFNKPADENEGVKFFTELSGNWHSVFTGVTVSKGNQSFTDAEETRVLLNPLTKQQINKFHTACHCADKAGGYSIMNTGSIIVKKIEGCYYNVTGLPVNTLQKLLLNVGIDLWDYIKRAK